MLLQQLQQAIVVGGTGAHDFGLLIVGVILLALGIIMNHFIPNRYWIILVALGIVLIVVWGILFAFSFAFILPSL
jgi:hypothetical protein